MRAIDVVDALGGERVLAREIRSDFDLAMAVLEGIPTDAVYHVLGTDLLNGDDMDALVISRRMLDWRRKRRRPLTITESDRLLRVVRVVVSAREALGTAERARSWLRAPNRALRGATPLTLLRTELGSRMVERVLGRIEHGVHA